MYSKQQASRLKQEFWTIFGQYMTPVVSAEGEKINWINYKTGVKNILLRMQADNKKATIAIELNHGDPEIQQMQFDQLAELKKLWHQILGEDWTWQLHSQDDHGKIVSRIIKEETGVNIFNKSDWPRLISFFKPRIMALDQFWSNVRYMFEALQ